MRDELDQKELLDFIEEHSVIYIRHSMDTTRSVYLKLIRDGIVAVHYGESLKKGSDSANLKNHENPENYYCQRKRLARKLDNPRLLQIGFHTLRHWKATKLYHQTKDVLYVKEFLSHKDINSTLMYVQIAKVVFGVSLNDEFICKVAKTPEEVSELIEAGFDYVTDFQGKRFFRKRK